MSRPPIKNRGLVKAPIATRLPFWLIVWLRRQDKPIAQIIEESIRRVYKLKAPVDLPPGIEPPPLKLKAKVKAKVKIKHWD